jgi:hypothetical protein
MQQMLIFFYWWASWVFSNMLLIQISLVYAGNRATNASSSNLWFASCYATGARDSNFMGFNAGLAATYASFKFLLVRVLVKQHMHLIQISLVSKLVVHCCF